MVTLLFIKLFCNNIFTFSVLFSFKTNLTSFHTFNTWTDIRIVTVQTLTLFKTIAIIRHKFLIITKISVIHYRQVKRHTREEYGFARTYFHFFLKSSLKRYLLWKFPVNDLKRFNQLEWNESRIVVRFPLDLFPLSLSVRIFWKTPNRFC